ncbi:MAG: VCBS repeat-containing protein [Planctomycetes bacterium]|nr:VCBS repeat-containing protein [Planctomycetota bacterium]
MPFLPIRSTIGALLLVSLAARAADAQASASILTTNGAGSLTTLSTENGFRTSWHQAIPGNFGGSGGENLLLYDRIQGEGKFLSSSTTGSLTTYATHTGWSTSWDQIVAGQFGGSSQDDLLFYDAPSGIGRFYTTGAGGSIALLRTNTGWNQYDTIVPGNFDGSGTTDLFFYSRTRGEGKFLRTDGSGNILLQSHLTTMSKNWDQIVPGDFDGNGTTDLFFYERIRGIAQFWSTNGTGGISLIRGYVGIRSSWDLIVPGNFGGTSHTDLCFYDRTAGEARFAFTDGAGGWALQTVRSTSPRWLHFVAGDFVPGRTSIYAYDGTLRVRIHAVRCMDSDGTRATAITPAEVRQWVDRANLVYSKAGVWIEFDERTDYEVLRNTTINTLDLCREFSSEAQCNVHKQAAETWALRYPCKIVVFFRYGNSPSPTGSGFSSEEANYVAMPGFNNTVTTQYFHDPNTPGHGDAIQGIKLLAHELGHYFGLNHTHVGIDYGNTSNPHAVVAAYLATLSNPTPDSLDGDGGDTWDTPPDPGIDYFHALGWNPADLDREIRINVPALGLDFTFSPDRSNVMSYWALCNGYLRVSPDQVREIREVLHGSKSQILDRCAHYVAGRKLLYGGGCPGTSNLAPTHDVAGTLEIGNAISLEVDNAVAGTSGVLWIGIQPLRLNLAGAGMGTCDLLVNQIVSLPFSTSRSGFARLSIAVPPDPSLVAAAFYSQAALLDLGTATPTKLTTTNGVETVVGGDR